MDKKAKLKLMKYIELAVSGGLATIVLLFLFTLILAVIIHEGFWIVFLTLSFIGLCIAFVIAIFTWWEDLKRRLTDGE